MKTNGNHGLEILLPIPPVEIRKIVRLFDRSEWIRDFSTSLLIGKLSVEIVGDKLIRGFTKKYNAHKLVYFEMHDSLKMALTSEKELKGISRAKGKKIVESLN